MELGHPEAAVLHEALGDLRALAGDYAGALVAYSAARDAGVTSATIARKIGEIHHRLGNWDAAETQFAAALADAGAGPAERAWASAAWSLTARRRGNLAQAIQLATEALTLADLRYVVGERDAAMGHLRAAVTLFAAIGHDQPEIWMLTEW